MDPADITGTGTTEPLAGGRSDRGDIESRTRRATAARRVVT